MLSFLTFENFSLSDAPITWPFAMYVGDLQLLAEASLFVCGQLLRSIFMNVMLMLEVAPFNN